MKVDVTSIENFENLSADELRDAILKLEIDDKSEALKEAEKQNAKLKDSLNKTSSEAADFKRKFKERQSEEERKEAERIEAEKAKDELIEKLTREKTISELTRAFAVAGEGASELAEAFLDKDTTVFANKFSKFIETHDKELNANSIRNMPRPDKSNGDGNAVSKEEFMKMGYQEMKAFKESNPDLYTEYMN